MSVGATLWRIGTDTPGFEAHDLSGKGAELTGGRWNRIGTPMLYASTSRALACLETMAHLASEPLPLNRCLVQISVPGTAWKSARVFDPARQIGWDALPAGKASLDWGTQWARERATLLAWVPSIVVPEEMNVLINPTHPDAAHVQATKARRWTCDARLAQRL